MSTTDKATAIKTFATIGSAIIAIIIDHNLGRSAMISFWVGVIWVIIVVYVALIARPDQP